MVKAGTAFCVPGSHDMKLQKYLNGKDVQLKHGLALTVEQLNSQPKLFIDQLNEFLYSLVSHYVLDDGRLVVAHAGLKEEMQGRGSGAVRSFCMYGETTGEIDEFGLPVRYNWAAEYRGKAMVVYGHTPVPNAQWLNKTIDIDTGCVFGGKLNALRYPEEELVSVDAHEVYCEPVGPLISVKEELSHQHQHDDLLDIDDVIGKHIITTRLRNSVTVREENSIAAVEVMSRFAVNPKWLIYLPPTMSPSETSEFEGYLEHPLYLPWYYYKAFDLSRLRFFATYGSLLFLLAPFVFLFALPYFITGDLQLSRKLVVIIPFLYGLAFIGATARAFVFKFKEREYSDKIKRELVIAAYLALLCWLALPVFVFFGDFQVLEQSVTNAGFLVLTIIYVRALIVQKRLEFIDLMKSEASQRETVLLNVKRYGLTAREAQVASMIVKGETYKIIGDELQISENLF